MRADALGQARPPSRWLMLGLVWVAYASFGLTTGSLPPLVGSITTDLGISSTQMGVVLGAWQLVYIGTAAPLGAVVDRFGVRRSVGVGLAVIWLSLALRGLAVDFFTLFGAVALFGFGGPIISTGAPKMVSQWFGGGERGLAAGIYNTAPVSGIAIGFATAPTLVEPLTGSWRGVSLVYGAVMLVVLAVWWLLARDAPASNDAPGVVQSGGRGRGAARELLRLRNVQVILLFAVGSFTINHGLQNWLPTLLRDDGMTAAQAGAWTAVATLAGAGGLLLIPSLARYGWRRWALAALLVVTAASTLGLGTLSGGALVGAMMAGAVVRSGLVAVALLVLMETRGVGALRMGTAAGLYFAVAEVGGFGGPFLLGAVRDGTGGLAAGMLALAALAAALALLMPLVREPKGVRENL
ncbi:MAG: MFS transporter [Chloroflexota bacterium]|nr:MFS transporter [Chloroflexota bacterium]